VTTFSDAARMRLASNLDHNQNAISCLSVTMIPM
jgi:hypothetical protein